MVNPTVQHLAEQHARSHFASLRSGVMGGETEHGASVPGDDSVFFVKHHQRGPQSDVFFGLRLISPPNIRVKQGVPAYIYIYIYICT